MINKPLRVVYSILDPFVSLRNVSGVSVLDGFMPHILLSLAQWMNFSTTLVREPHDRYGSNENNTWNGMVGMLIRNQVDMILNPVIPRVEMAGKVFYTNPVAMEAFTFLSGKIQRDASFFLYFSVYEPKVWLGVFIAYIVVSVTCYRIARRLSRFRRITKIQLCCEYLWNFLAYTLRQNPSQRLMFRRSRKKLSVFSPLITMLWALGVSFMVMNVFQSLLVSKLTVVRTDPLIDSMASLVEKKHIKGIVPIEIEISDVLQNSGIKLYDQLWTTVRSNLMLSSEVFSQKSLQEVQDGKVCIIHGKLILRAILSKYFNAKKECNFHLSKSYFYPFPLVMAVSKTLPEPFIEKLNMGLTRLIDGDVPGRWFKPIQEASRSCTSYSKSTLTALSLKHIYGVLLMWAAGLAISVIVLLHEIVLSKITFL